MLSTLCKWSRPNSLIADCCIARGVLTDRWRWLLLSSLISLHSFSGQREEKVSYCTGTFGQRSAFLLKNRTFTEANHSTYTHRVLYPLRYLILIVRFLLQEKAHGHRTTAPPARPPCRPPLLNSSQGRQTLSCRDAAQRRGRLLPSAILTFTYVDGRRILPNSRQWPTRVRWRAMNKHARIRNAIEYTREII